MVEAIEWIHSVKEHVLHRDARTSSQEGCNGKAMLIDTHATSKRSAASLIGMRKSSVYLVAVVLKGNAHAQAELAKERATRSMPMK